jgi:hypothetical protein
VNWRPVVDEHVLAILGVVREVLVRPEQVAAVGEAAARIQRVLQRDAPKVVLYAENPVDPERASQKEKALSNRAQLLVKLLVSAAN